MSEVTDSEQECADRFYFENGPCCAGCDYWHRISSSHGHCQKAAPISGEQRLALLGIEFCTLQLGAGHPLTRRDHHCGDFKDEFDWASLSPFYLARVSAPTGD